MADVCVRSSGRIRISGRPGNASGHLGKNIAKRVVAVTEGRQPPSLLPAGCRRLPNWL